MKKCLSCGNYSVKNPTHDYCHDCFFKLELEEELIPTEVKFEDSLITSQVHTVYVMFYGNREFKIGYTNDLNSRIIEIRREHPNNKLVYFREFTKESEARRFESWLKNLSDREKNKFIGLFQDKIIKIGNVFQ